MLMCDLAWVMGAADPTSGTVSIHEVVRGFGALLRNGWKPLRNVVFASWDAEEVRNDRDFSPSCRQTSHLAFTQYGLIGSTEWAEDFSEWLTENVVAYINLGQDLTTVSQCKWPLH